MGSLRYTGYKGRTLSRKGETTGKPRAFFGLISEGLGQLGAINAERKDNDARDEIKARTLEDDIQQGYLNERRQDTIDSKQSDAIIAQYNPQGHDQVYARHGASLYNKGGVNSTEELPAEKKYPQQPRGERETSGGMHLQAGGKNMMDSLRESYQAEPNSFQSGGRSQVPGGQMEQVTDRGQVVHGDNPEMIDDVELGTNPGEPDAIVDHNEVVIDAVDENGQPYKQIFTDSILVPGKKISFAAQAKKYLKQMPKDEESKQAKRLYAKLDKLFDMQQMLNGNSHGEGPEQSAGQQEPQFKEGGVAGEETKDSDLDFLDNRYGNKSMAQAASDSTVNANALQNFDKNILWNSAHRGSLDAKQRVGGTDFKDSAYATPLTKKVAEEYPYAPDRRAGYTKMLGAIRAGTASSENSNIFYNKTRFPGLEYPDATPDTLSIGKPENQYGGSNYLFGGSSNNPGAYSGYNDNGIEWNTIESNNGVGSFNGMQGKGIQGGVDGSFGNEGGLNDFNQVNNQVSGDWKNPAGNDTSKADNANKAVMASASGIAKIGQAHRYNPMEELDKEYYSNRRANRAESSAGYMQQMNSFAKNGAAMYENGGMAYEGGGINYPQQGMAFPSDQAMTMMDVYTQAKEIVSIFESDRPSGTLASLQADIPMHAGEPKKEDTSRRSSIFVGRKHRPNYVDPSSQVSPSQLSGPTPKKRNV